MSAKALNGSDSNGSNNKGDLESWQEKQFLAERKYYVKTHKDPRFSLNQPPALVRQERDKRQIIPRGQQDKKSELSAVFY